MRYGRTPARESRGFTLIEVLLATVLLATGCGSAGGSAGSVQRVTPSVQR